jgi:DNA polymerase-3 subunit delta
MAKSGLSRKELETRFRSGKFDPVYFLYGEEQYLVEQVQRLLIETALEPHERDFNLDIVYGTETDTQSVLALCASYPVMAQRRVVLVRQFEKIQNAERFAAYAKQPNETAVVMLACATKPNLRNNPYRGLKAHAAWAEFKPLYDREVPGWIDGRVKEEGREIEPDAVQMLAQLVGNNLRGLSAEIEKLVTYAGERKSIKKEDVLDVGGFSRQYNVFELQRTVANGRYAEAVRIMEHMLQLSSNRAGTALMVVAVLAKYFVRLRKLVEARRQRVPEKGMAERIGVPVYYIKEYVSALRRFPAQDIEGAFGALLAADYELKGGSHRGESLILTLLLRRLLQGERGS